MSIGLGPLLEASSHHRRDDDERRRRRKRRAQRNDHPLEDGDDEVDDETDGNDVEQGRGSWASCDAGDDADSDGIEWQHEEQQQQEEQSCSMPLHHEAVESSISSNGSSVDNADDVRMVIHHDHHHQFHHHHHRQQQNRPQAEFILALTTGFMLDQCFQILLETTGNQKNSNHMLENIESAAYAMLIVGYCWHHVRQPSSSSSMMMLPTGFVLGQWMMNMEDIIQYLMTAQQQQCDRMLICGTLMMSIITAILFWLRDSQNRRHCHRDEEGCMEDDFDDAEIFRMGGSGSGLQVDNQQQHVYWIPFELDGSIGDDNDDDHDENDYWGVSQP